MKKRYIIIAIVLILFLVAALIYAYTKNGTSIRTDEKCASVSVIGGADGPTSVFIAGKVGGSEMADYKTITMKDAKTIFAAKGDYLILDVRREDEFVQVCFFILHVNHLVLK